jgi:hypothetical protein
MAHLVFAVILSVLIPAGISTRAQGAEETFREGLLGEKDLALYAGPWYPRFRVDPYFGQTRADDDQFLQNYVLPLIWSEAVDWNTFFSDEVSGASTCPNEVLQKHFEGLRYGHRLLTLSYLLEGLDAAQHDLVKLRKSPGSCAVDLVPLIKTCQPKTLDMKEFLAALARQNPYTQTPLDKTHHFQKFESDWLREITTPGMNISAVRTSSRCAQEGVTCRGLDQAVPALVRACDEDKALFRQVCSEDDQLFGTSHIPVTAHLLATSNLMNLYNTEGSGAGCLRRFGQLMARKEKVPVFLVPLIPVVHASMKQRFSDQQNQGRAFVFGALKEFRDKGLAQVFEAKVEEERPELVEAKPPAAVEPPKPAKPRPVAEVVAVEKPRPKKPEVAEVPKSAFLQAAEIRRGQDLRLAHVDMLKFKYDHVFSLSEFQLLSSTLKEYTSRRALDEMREHDRLGSVQAPVPLSFLKFLIDGDNHQGLYNLVNVLGDEFWVTNDIDARWKPAPEYIAMKNDESTSRQWQISIVRP